MIKKKLQCKGFSLTREPGRPAVFEIKLVLVEPMLGWSAVEAAADIVEVLSGKWMDIVKVNENEI